MIGLGKERPHSCGRSFAIAAGDGYGFRAASWGGVSRKGRMAYIFPWYRANGPAHPSLGRRPRKRIPARIPRAVGPNHGPHGCPALWHGPTALGKQDAAFSAHIAALQAGRMKQFSSATTGGLLIRIFRHIRNLRYRWRRLRVGRTAPLFQNLVGPFEDRSPTEFVEAWRI